MFMESRIAWIFQKSNSFLKWFWSAHELLVLIVYAQMHWWSNKAHADVTSTARGLKCLSLHLHSYFMLASSKCYGESADVRWLAYALAANTTETTCSKAGGHRLWLIHDSFSSLIHDSFSSCIVLIMSHFTFVQQHSQIYDTPTQC